MAPKSGFQCMWSSVLALVLPAFVYASPTPVTKSELQKALGFYQAIKKLEVDFKQTKILKDIQLELKSEGHLSLNPPHHVQWKIVRPEPLTVDMEEQKLTISNGNSTQTFSQSANPSAKDRKSFATLLSWLKLDADVITSQYEVSKLSANHYRFESKDKNEPMLRSLEMVLTPAGHLASLVFHEISGDELRLQFAKPNVVLRGQ